jgi:lysophospholipase L1-like esterase/1-acyl-sn-glycerol-3-phosphate acyltransferase
MEVQEQDKKFLSALKRVYKAVSTAPASLPPLEARGICTARIREAFSMADIQIKGSEYLPYQKNAIFIYNHLNNHAYYTEDEGFQITLDSHFISSMILEKYYKDSGIRVVRHSLPEEDNHRTYYERLKYIRVYAKNFLAEGLDPNLVKSVNKDFYIKAIKHLSQGSGLVFSPEGNSYKTGDSPGTFRYGIFKLAACMSPQPLIVPLVMANFDKLASQYTYKCEIKPPFKMRDLGITDKNDAALPEVVAKLNHQYKHWVSDLLTEEMDFESEISKLEKQIKNIKTTDDLVVFYGSSTIRLWNSLQDDFPHTNTLNLGFGGAFISSLSQNFERLFTFEAPKAIVLYLGGNDLSLGWTAEKIIKKIKTLIAIIHSKFPGTSIINLSIKPSIERSNQIEKIIQINKAIILFAEKTDFLIHVNIFDDLLKDGKANPNYFLRDGLHLNGDGYKILKKQIKNYL